MTTFPEKINNLTYEEFTKITTAIKTYHKFSDNLYEMSDHSIDIWEVPQISNLECELTEVISKLMNDELDTLNYFIFEIGFGEDYHKCEYDTGDGIIETPLTNFRELWLYYALDNKIIDKNEYQKLLEESN